VQTLTSSMGSDVLPASLTVSALRRTHVPLVCRGTPTTLSSRTACSAQFGLVL
jgi:hypothetical protein